MRSLSASSDCDQQQADANGDGPHDPKRRVRHIGQFAQVRLELIGECEVGKAFDDEDHPDDAEKIVHDRSGCPFRRFLFRFVPEPVHFGER